LVIGLACPAAAQPQLDEAAADELVRKGLAAWDVPGAALIVVSRDRAHYIKGHGVRQLGRPEPITLDTVFPFASCTKGFTATVVAQLVDDGTMQWDDPVRKHWPEFRLADPAADQSVAIRDLLCHRTGLAGHDELWYRTPWPQAEIVRRAGFLPPAAPFRTQFRYQSTMVSAAGLAAGRAAGRPWDALVRERLLAPLGMTNTTCVTPTTPDRAMPHRPGPDGRLAVIDEYPQPEPNPAGSMYGSARDLAAWLRFQLGDGKWFARRLVSEENFAETHTPQTAQRLAGVAAATHASTTMMSYGLGWVIQDYGGHLLRTHTGVVDGYRIQIAVAPRADWAVAVLSNRHETRMNLAVVNAALDRLLGLPERDWNGYLKRVVAREDEFRAEAARERERTRQPGMPPLPTEAFAGVYTHPAFGDMTISTGDGRLVWAWHAARSPLRWHHDGEYDLDVPWAGESTISFAIEGGRATAMTMFGCRLTRR
jgi:CubicO group peptidase (beta-lactamase class C family)